jgi:regulatory LuxR family protein
VNGHADKVARPARAQALGCDWCVEPPARALADTARPDRERDEESRRAADEQSKQHDLRQSVVADDALALSLAPGTVKKHLDNIYTKLGVRNRVEAARAWQTAR